jgi:hypothetical protein
MRILITFVLLFSIKINAETSEQYTYRAEFFFGNMSEGKNYEDVRKQNMEYLKFLKENNLKYGRALFVPIWAGEREYDIIEYGWWPNGVEQYKEWGAYMNDYPKWAADNSEFDGESGVEVKRSISMRGVRARGIRIPAEEMDKFKFVDFMQCSYTSLGNLNNILEINAKIEAKEIELGNRAGYGEHILIPYRGLDADTKYDFVIMRHYYSAKKRGDIISSSPEFRNMMRETGYWAELQTNAKCGPQSTYRVEWLYNSSED